MRVVIEESSIPSDMRALNISDNVTRPARPMRRFGPLLALVIAAGCYRTMPVETPSPVAGREVVVELTDAGAVQLAPTIGTRIEAVRGTVAEASDGRLALLMRGATSRTGSETPWAGERVELPREYIASVRERRFDRTRSILFTAAIVGAVVLAGGILAGGAGLSGFWGIGGGARQ